MRRLLPATLWLCLIAISSFALAQQVIDVPTRPGITQRILLVTPPPPKAAVILFAGGDGGLQIGADGNIGRLKGNFLVRSRQLFADQGLAVAVADAPSDRPDLGGFRNTPEHADDIRAVIAWLKDKVKVPVWLIGTSRGTQSVASVATRLVSGGGPDGIVLTSSILADPRSPAVPDMPMEKLEIPVLIVHHEEDGCRLCQFSDMPRLMDKIAGLKHKALISFKGGSSVGNPCAGRAYHGYNGLEHEVVAKISAWITAKP